MGPSSPMVKRSRSAGGVSLSQATTARVRRVTPQLNLVQSRTSGTPVVFQHGLCGSAAQTAEAFPDDPAYRMLTLECRGHGASHAGDTKAFSIKTFAHDVAWMVEAQNIAPCIIGGISMGAAISLHLAIHRPDLVKALVLARPAWLIEDGPANMQPNAEVGSLLSRFSSAEAKAKFIAGDTAKALAQTAPTILHLSSAFSTASHLM